MLKRYNLELNSIKDIIHCKQRFQMDYCVNYRNFTLFLGLKRLLPTSFKVSGDSSEVLWKLCFSTKFPHQKIR